MKYDLITQVLHQDYKQQLEYGSVHQPIYSSVAYGYQSTQELTDVFQNKTSGFVYGRQSNPTIDAFSQKITLLEQGVGSVLFSTGMSAIASTCLALLKKDDHIICSQFLFGNTCSLFTTLESIGIKITFVDATKVENIEKAWIVSTKMVFVETIANPVTQISDLEKIGIWCESKKCLYVVDSTMTSPYLFQPKNVKASLIIHSLTKYIGGHGHALGGAVTDTGLFDWEQFSNIFDLYKKNPVPNWGILQIRKKGLRDFGGTLSSNEAHLLSMGLETLHLRMRESCSNALALAILLNEHPLVEQVYYPGLESHPQFGLSKKLFRFSGSILSFVLKEEVNHFDFLDRLKLAIKSSNLGDNRTLVIPVAQTIYFEMDWEQRKKMGIFESLIRVSVGIEDQQDILSDFIQAFN